MTSIWSPRCPRTSEIDEKVLKMNDLRPRLGRSVPLAVVICLTSAIHAAAPDVAAILRGTNGVTVNGVATDRQGNIFAAGTTSSTDLPITQGALQPTLAGFTDAFVAKFSAKGILLWLTYFGGKFEDGATALAVDGTGNVIVAGFTSSPDFPLAHAYQSIINNGLTQPPGQSDGFVLMLDPTGTKILYSTYLGSYAAVTALAVDPAGAAYLTGSINLFDPQPFPAFNKVSFAAGSFVAKLTPSGAFSYAYLCPDATTAIAVDPGGSAYVAVQRNVGQAVVFKLSSDGSRELYDTPIGAGNPTAIAVDASGSAYLAGVTTSVSFPLVHSLQTSIGARPLWKSTDAGATWTAFGNLPFAFLTALVMDPLTPTTLYAGTLDGGVFKSLDSGVTWQPSGSGIFDGKVFSLAIDPVNPQILHAGGFAGIYRSKDAGATWVLVAQGTDNVIQLVVDPQNPKTSYSVDGPGRLYKTDDGGDTWSMIKSPVAAVALDPHTAGSVWAVIPGAVCGKLCTGGTPASLQHSVDGGATFQTVLGVVPSGLVIDGSTNPSTLYAGLAASSTDGGVTWTPMTPPTPSFVSYSLGTAKGSASVLYAGNPCDGMFVTSDRGRTWKTIGSPIPAPSSCQKTPPLIQAILAGAQPGTLFAIVQNTQSSGFVSKLSPDGATLAFSTLLHGSQAMVGTAVTGPIASQDQNWISSLALDPQGNIVVAGGTYATDFPAVNPRQPCGTGADDAFVSVIAADGNGLIYSSCVGGSSNDVATAVAVDAQGNVVLVGETLSTDFPGAPAAPAQSPNSFLVKLSVPTTPVITSVVNGASLQPGIEAGSWVTIRGANLANTNPGRTWRSNEIVNGALPVVLDGVSVTIDGKPAFVE
jgi:hypothetical protein